jgi:hypothetical protein
MMVLDLSGITNENGVLLQSLEQIFAQGAGKIKITQGTIALTNNGVPLSTINVQSVGEPPAPSADCCIIGLVYDFEPKGATFDPPASITLQYGPTSCPEGVDEKDLVIAYYDVNAGKWVSLSSKVDTAAHIITAEVSHFTLFAIVGKIAPQSTSGVSWPMVGGIITTVLIMGAMAYLVLSRRRSTTKS